MFTDRLIIVLHPGQPQIFGKRGRELAAYATDARIKATSEIGMGSNQFNGVAIAARPLQTCIFCGGRPMSGEHLFSEWISKIVPRTTMRHRQTQTTVDPSGEVVLRGNKRFEGDIASKKLRVVCIECNRGWMGDIEIAAIPIMTPLILGHQALLTTEQKRVIATWER